MLTDAEAETVLVWCVVVVDEGDDEEGDVIITDCGTWGAEVVTDGAAVSGT